jgi:hypothetical protein
VSFDPVIINSFSFFVLYQILLGIAICLLYNLMLEYFSWIVGPPPPPPQKKKKKKKI